MDTKTQHPQTAFRFDLSRPTIIQAGMDGGGEDGDKKKKKRRKFKGMAYSGKPLRHPYWGSVAFDLSSTEAPDPVPILVEHDRGKRAGFATLSIGDNIEIADGTLLDNEHGMAVADESDAGFPWQMSIHIEPGSVEEVKAGASAVVNGHTVSGPAYVFRNNLIREVSFTPTGVDYNTSAAAMSTGATAQISQHHEGDNDMSEQLENRIRELQASLEQAQAQAQAATERAEAAEKALESMRREARMSAVRELFSALGREFSEEAAKPYLEMTDEMFSAVAKDLKAAKPKAPDHLFSSQADDGRQADDLAQLLINA